jgi:TP901 family phage tail tape measure protein
MAGKEYTMMFKLQAELGSAFSSAFNNARTPVLALQTEINKLNKTQSDISAYQKQQQAITQTAARLKMLKEQYDNIQQEMKETGNDSAAMKNKLISKQMQIDRTSNSLNQQTDKLNNMDASLKKAGVNTANLTNEAKRLDAEMDRLKDSQLEAASASEQFGQSAHAAVINLQSILASAGIVAGFKKVADGFKASAESAIAFESAMAGVDKTTDMTPRELQIMGNEFQRLSTVIPVSANELAGIAEVAGQLGIAKPNLLDFTEIMAKLSTATTMTAEHGATMLAQFANITQMDPAHYERLASAVVDLGNNYATTEQRIIDMSQGMAASASLAGMSEADILGLATAISSLGIESQAGSSSAATLITELDKSVKTGKGLADFGRIANMTATDFAKAWGEDAAGALSLFVQGLNDTERHGKSATVILEEMGITERRMQRMVLSLANSGDLMNRAIWSSNEAWRENTALQIEAEKRYGTTESKLGKARNAFENLKVTIGEHLTPVIGTLADAFTDIVTGINNWMDRNPEITAGILGMVAILGVGMAGIAAYTGVVKLAEIAMLAFKSAIPGIGWVIGGIATLALLGGAFIALTTHIENNRETFQKLDEQFDELMGTIGEQNKTLELVEEYKQLSSEIEVGTGKVADYQAQQQKLWDAYASGKISTEDYQAKITALREEYTKGITASDDYKKKEQELWNAYTNGKISLTEYTAEIEKVRTKHAEAQSAVENYKKQEEALWEAYTSGQISVEEYTQKLTALQTELQHSGMSSGELADKQQRLAELKQTLRDRSDGLITATDNETEAFNRQAQALESLIQLERDQARASAYENLTKQSKAYTDAINQEKRSSAELIAAQEKQNAIIGIIGGGYDQAVDKAHRLGQAMETVWDNRNLTEEEKWQKHNELVREASQLMSILYGESIDYSGNPANFFYDLNNIDKGSTKFRKSWQEANDEVKKYQGEVSEAQKIQSEFLQNLADGFLVGGISLEEYETMLVETFGQYENGAQIVADIMDYIRGRVSDTASGSAEIGEGMQTAAEQALELETAVLDVKKRMDELAGAYKKAYDSAYSSISGQLKLFDDMKKVNKKDVKSADQMLASLNQQAQYLDSYTANLERAKELGVAKELVAQLSDGSVESATHLQTIVNSSAEKIGEINAAFEKVSEGKEAFAATVAEMQTDFTAKMTELQQELVTKVGQMNLHGEAAAAGQSTIQGLISGAEGMLPQVTEAYSRIAQAAIDAIKAKMKIESPSKVMEEVSMYNVLGLVKGAERNRDRYAEAMNEMAQAGINAYSDADLVSALGSNAFEQDGRIFVRPPQTESLLSPSQMPGYTMDLTVAPVYNLNGISHPEAVKEVLARHDDELRTMVLEIVEENGIDQRRRRYEP